MTLFLKLGIAGIFIAITLFIRALLDKKLLEIGACNGYFKRLKFWINFGTLFLLLFLFTYKLK